MRFSVLLLIPFAMQASLGYVEPWGKDANLRPPKQTADIRPSESAAVFLAQKVIDFHQQVLSPVDGPRSHFVPCSSKYMRLAMIKHGFLQGFIMGCDRLLRENKDPWLYREVLIDNQLVKYDPPK